MRFALLVAALALLFTVQSVHADTLVYEGFDYAPGDVAGKGGGTGFSGNWAAGGFNASISTQQDVVSPSLSHANVISSGNRVSSPVLTALGGVRRTFAANLGADNTTVYLSFLIRADGTLNQGVFNGFFGVYLDSIVGGPPNSLSGEPDLFIGKAGGGVLDKWLLEARGGGGQVASDDTITSGITAHLVVKAEFKPGLDTFSLFVNPGLLEPAVADAVKGNIDLGVVNAMVIYNSGAFSIDEIRIGTTFADAAADPNAVPLPAVAALLPALLFGRGLFGRRRSPQ